LSRPRAFDEEEVLDRAISCFWRHGLEATSVRDLTEEMGINAPSLYNAFGDKRRLFVLALERYATQTTRARLARLTAEHPPKAAIIEFFDEIIERSVNDPDRRGCLIVNSALEVAPHDPEIRRVINGYLEEIEGFFAGRIAAAQAAGQVPTSLDPGETGRLLKGLLVAIRVLSRTGTSKGRLQDTVRPALGLLDRR
jgi:TetR/AcrR family transcriptional repressor of nem operon